MIPQEASSHLAKCIPDHLGYYDFKTAQFQYSSGQEDVCDLSPLVRFLDRQRQQAFIPHIIGTHPDISLDDMYVEIALSDYQESRIQTNSKTLALQKQSDRFGKRMEQKVPLEQVVDNNQSNLRVIFGDPGSGKSTLSIFLNQQIASGSLGYDAIIPLFVRLREVGAFHQPETSGIDFIDYFAREMSSIESEVSILKTFLAHLTATKHVIFVLDGYDEITHQVKFANQAAVAIRRLSNTSRVILTSRRAGFRGQLGHFTPYEVVDLSDQSIKALISNWFQSVFNEPELGKLLFDRVVQERNLYSMARNPCLLSLICFISQSQEDSSFLKSQNKAELYQCVINTIQEQTYLDKQCEFSGEAMSQLKNLSLYLYTKEGSLPLQLFKREDYNSYLKELNSSNPKSDIHNYLETPWLKSRLIDQWSNTFPLYYYLHLSFQEFLCAEALLEMTESEVSNIIETYRYNPHWQEVWRFYAGGLISKGGKRETRERRFIQLINPMISEPDLLHYSYFYAAPIWSEYEDQRAVDTMGGFDLKEQLLIHYIEGEGLESAYLRKMVSLSPSYFLSYAAACILHWTERNELNHLFETREVLKDLGFTNLERFSDFMDSDEGLGNAFMLLDYIQHEKVPKLHLHLLSCHVKLLKLADDESYDLERLESLTNDVYNMSLKADYSPELIIDDLIILYNSLDNLEDKLSLSMSLSSFEDERLNTLLWNDIKKEQDLHLLTTLISDLCASKSKLTVPAAELYWGHSELHNQEDSSVNYMMSLESIGEVQFPEVQRMLERWLEEADSVAQELFILDKLTSFTFFRETKVLEPYLDHASSEISLLALESWIRRKKDTAQPRLHEILSSRSYSPEQQCAIIEVLAEECILNTKPILQAYCAKEKNLLLQLMAYYALLQFHRNESLPIDEIVQWLDKYVKRALEEGYSDEIYNILQTCKEMPALEYRKVLTVILKHQGLLDEIDLVRIASETALLKHEVFRNLYQEWADSENMELTQYGIEGLAGINLGWAVSQREHMPHIIPRVLRTLSQDHQWLIYPAYHIDSLGVISHYQKLLLPTSYQRVAYDIFISYARIDGHRYAKELYARLVEAGYSVFMDERYFRPGDHLEPELAQQVQNCKLHLVLATLGASQSNWVQFEVEERLKSGGKLHLIHFPPIDESNLNKLSSLRSVLANIEVNAANHFTIVSAKVFQDLLRVLGEITV